MLTSPPRPPTTGTADPMGHDEGERRPEAGWQHLVAHLLDRSSLPADAKALARSLLLVEGLQPLPLLSLDGRPPPLALWRRKANAHSAAQILLLDLGGAGAAAVQLPSQALPSGEDSLFLVVPNHSGAALGGRPPAGDARSCACAVAADEASFPGVFSPRELANGQLHVRVPPCGVASYDIVPAAFDGAAGAARAHMLSALFRLGRRSVEHAAHNAAAAALRSCACADSDSSADHWRRLWRSLHPTHIDKVEPLARVLSAAVHTAAAAGLLDEGAADRRSALRQALNGLARAIEEEEVADGMAVGVAAEVAPDGVAVAGRAPHSPERDGGFSIIDASFEHAFDHLRSPTSTLDPSFDDAQGQTSPNHREGSKPPTSCRPPKPLARRSSADAAYDLAPLRRVLAMAERTHVAMVAPEVGVWCSVGGLGTMVSHLSISLAAHGGCVSVIAPAYACFRSRWAELPVLTELSVPIGLRTALMRVRYIVEHGVAVYLLEVASGAASRFAAPYPKGDAATRLLPAVLLARGALLLLEHLRHLRTTPPPDVVVSNDWVASLVAPYARHTSWAGSSSAAIGALSSSTLFLHLVHNLESGYDGRLAMPTGGPPAALAALHQLPYHLMHERRAASGSPAVPDCLQLTRAALLCCEAWGTVSTSYREELLASSTYAPLLAPFGDASVACDSGLPLTRRRLELSEHGDHASAKAELQRACFGEAGVQARTPLLIFLGRIAYQKGVHLLLDSFPALMRATDGKVQLLVCGCADTSDSYAERCAAQMGELRRLYPRHFWAAPREYFDRGLLASLAADFGVMPSLYEPWGLVREEFFAAGTPLVCSNVGGLKERVTPYEPATQSGEGVVFGSHSHASLLSALQAAVRLHADDAHYAALRRNAYGAAYDIADTAWHWRCELRRLLACRCHARLDEFV